MEFVYILKRLWNRRALVAVGVVLATIAAILTVARIEPGSFKLESRAVTVGAASTEILVDAKATTLGDLRREIEPFTARCAIFTRFLASEGATRTIAAEAGIPEREIAVSAPTVAAAGTPGGASEEGIAKLDGGRRYMLRVAQTDALPVLSVLTQAPTEAGARRLANATATALIDTVRKLQAESGIPEQRRVEIRQLGTARSGVLEEKPNKLLAVAAFLGVLGIFCLAILALPNLVAAWRYSDRDGYLEPARSNGFGDIHNGNGWPPGRRRVEDFPALLSATMAPTALLPPVGPEERSGGWEHDDEVEDDGVGSSDAPPERQD
jgi:hypothetical protein